MPLINLLTLAPPVAFFMPLGKQRWKSNSCLFVFVGKLINLYFKWSLNNVDLKVIMQCVLDQVHLKVTFLHYTISGRLWSCRDKMTEGRFLSSLFKTCLQKQINSLSSCLDWLNCIDNLLKCKKRAYFLFCRI